MVDRDPPAGDRDPGLPGGDERGLQPARAGRRVELQRDRHLADRAVRADGVHHPHVRAARPARAGTLRPGGAARRSRSSTPAAARRRATAPGRRRAPCAGPPRRACRRRSPPAAPRATRSVSAPPNGATPITSTFAPELSPRRRSPRSGTGRARVGHDVGRDARRPAASSTTATTSRVAVAQDAVRGLGVGRRAKRPPVKSASRSATPGSTPRPGRVARARAGRPRGRAR